ncbi:spondin domain-containing protein [Gilvimarinus agarilyticus]|uniref:spondin domain-containing protein n=1 Tax=Gilvimarinus agarilyticus TaxID=679259 RepID=UPI00059F9362|nr:spondin domain-containing protein [Gilvimarinus agarilyticus]
MNKHYLLTSVCALSLALAGCGSDDDDTLTPPPEPESEPIVYSVTVTNLTRGQPLSPMALMLAGPEFTSARIGEPVSVALEVLAESGDNSQLLEEAGMNQHVYASASAEGGPLMPGASTTLELTLEEPDEAIYLELVSMLANTNDGIAMLSAKALSGLQLNESVSFMAPAYDTGTEFNSESADTIIGPAAAGGAQQGFSEVRDDIADALTLHSGVVSFEDGLASSALSQAQRFDNPVMQVRVTRLE